MVVTETASLVYQVCSISSSADWKFLLISITNVWAWNLEILLTWDEKKNGLGHCGIDCGCGRATGHNAAYFATLHMRRPISPRRRSLSGLSLAAAAILHYYIGLAHQGDF